jgi:aminoglycoside phosphotransferase (APT) family kinase protein
VPYLVARGESELASWSLERRLVGAEPATLSDTIVADCVDFLVGLHRTEVGKSTEGIFVEWAHVVARACRADLAVALTTRAERLELELADLPRGIGHGDFWRGNLLVENGRLAGVVDWAAAGGSRLPLVDLLNLYTAEHEPRYFGRALVEYLLPWARSGGDDIARAYCDRLGIGIRPGVLEALAIACWLERAARELETYGDRIGRPAWLLNNVEVALRALVGPGAMS